MDEFASGGYRVRSWVGSLPPAFYEVDRVIESSLVAGAPGLGEERIAAVEFYRHVGPRVHYGLLGATLSPAEMASLDLKLCVSSGQPTSGRVFTDTIARHEDIYAGLPTEYADCIIKGLSEAVGQLTEIRAGQILLNCAAYSVVSSNESTYNRLSITLINLLYYPERSTSLLRELCEY